VITTQNHGRLTELEEKWSSKIAVKNFWLANKTDYCGFNYRVY
jgi:hypothetical protein